MSRRRLAMVGALLLLGTGCKGVGSAPPTRCERPAQLCRLPSGPLGVCTAVPCPRRKTASCLKCMPQH